MLSSRFYKEELFYHFCFLLTRVIEKLELSILATAVHSSRIDTDSVCFWCSFQKNVDETSLVMAHPSHSNLGYLLTRSFVACVDSTSCFRHKSRCELGSRSKTPNF